MPLLTLTDFRLMSSTEPDNDRLLNRSKHSFPVFISPGCLEVEQKLKPKDGRTAPLLGSNGSPEQRIGRWNYTIVPWED
jgi:hypothetical protein